MIQVTADDIEEAKATITAFMGSGKNVDFRKDFMNSVFDKLDKESLSY